MPELPEVEVAARSLRRWAGKKTIRGVRADPKAARLFRPATPKAVEALAGARFGDVRRIGKNLLLTLVPPGRPGTTAPLGVWSHLGMTGKWLRRTAKDPAPAATRLEIELAGGVRLCYVDQRMFGRFRLVPGARFDSIPEIAALGPDPLNDGIDVPSFAKRLARLKLPSQGGVARPDAAGRRGEHSGQRVSVPCRDRSRDVRPARSRWRR